MNSRFAKSSWRRHCFLDPENRDRSTCIYDLDMMYIHRRKSRTEAVHVALREIVATKRFKDLMRKHRGKLAFAGYDE